jgi:hypothetical protein
MSIFKSVNPKAFLLAATILASPLLLAAPSPASAQIAIGLSVQIAPPILPVYDQPPIPAPGYLWTPGYWHYSVETGYYWVPGTWVLPPTVGVLWTPPYWGWSNGAYVFNAGYWGPHVGFYGGINYGFGFGGVGFEGGVWNGGVFSYNRTVNNFGSTHIENTYEKNVTINKTTNVSYNGGTGGVKAEPTPEEKAAESEKHVPATEEQTRHATAAAKEPSNLYKNNHGVPKIAATSKPGEFKGPGVVKAKAKETRAAQHAAPKPEHAEHAEHPEHAAPKPEHAAPKPEHSHPAEHAPAKPEEPKPESKVPPHPEPAHEPPPEKKPERKPEL